MTDPGRSGGEGTGWHRHEDGSMCDRPSERFPYTCAGPTTPVIVLDPVAARDTIARALRAEMFYSTHTDRWDDAEWQERLWNAGADAVLAALASQERGE